MSSLSVGLLLLSLFSATNTWELPPECQPLAGAAPPHPDPPPPHPPSTAIPTLDNTTTTADPTTDPTHEPTAEPTASPTSPTDSPTASPTRSYDEACCIAINHRYNYSADQDNSTCSSLHTEPSCATNTNGKISSIHLEYCSLTGSIPHQFQYMNQLRTLSLSHNPMEGAIPTYFNNYTLFPLLQRWQMTDTNLSGRIPSNLFQYDQLSSIDFRNNKRLTLDITNLNLTYNPIFDNKRSISANFSFLHLRLDNDTDANFYTFFDRIRFASLSMRSSVNQLTFKWQNKDKRNNYHKISATTEFDFYGNNLTGEFPCFYKTWPMNIYLANNFITSWNITCYDDKNFNALMLFQQQAAYQRVTQCYSNYVTWATDTDHYKYCMYSDYAEAPISMRNCCKIAPTPHPTLRPTVHTDSKSSDTTVVKWLIQNVQWFVLLLILSFAAIVCAIWRKNRKKKLSYTELKKLPSTTTRKKSTHDGESLLYGDF